MVASSTALFITSFVISLPILDLIIETGVARAGSMIFYASLLQLIGKKNSRVLGIDIDIRKHALHVYKNHFLRKRLKFIK